jgi:hypothetical protein
MGPETRGVCCITGLDNNDGMMCTSSIAGTITVPLYVTLEPSPLHTIETGLKVVVGNLAPLISSAPLSKSAGNLQTSVAVDVASPIYEGCCLVMSNDMGEGEVLCQDINNHMGASEDH